MLFDFSLIAYVTLGIYVILGLLCALAGYFLVKQVLRGIKHLKESINSKKLVRASGVHGYLEPKKA